MGIVIGLDPGLNFTGWGVLSFCNPYDVVLLGSGVVSTVRHRDLPSKLHSIFTCLTGIIKSYDISEASIENVFVNSNPRSSMSLCYARGAAILSVMVSGKDIYEYSSTFIKKCTTGKGNASKEQVAFMVKKITGLEEELNPNTSDAIAAAICHIYSCKVP